MIQIHDISFGFKKRELLFENMNLTFAEGRIYGLLGRNGTGKSTLLKLISGLLFPQNGMIEIDGFEPKNRNPHFLQDLFLITEEFNLPALKIKEFVSLYSAFYPKFDNDNFESYMQEFKLPKHQIISSMSYGQKKKFLLSFGLATNCKILILDEPTNGLDILSKSQFRKIIATAFASDRTFIISTHQIKDLENLIDSILIIEDGKIILDESYETISSKISVKQMRSLPVDGSVIYSESSLANYTVVKEKSIEEEESNMNLEFLFKAVVDNPVRFSNIFEKVSHEY